MKKQNKIHVKRVVSLQGSTLVLGKSSGNAVHELTEKEQAACGIDVADSPKDIAEQKDVEFTEIKLNRKTADPPIDKASYNTLSDSDLLFSLFADLGFTIQLIAILLLSRCLSVFGSESLLPMQVLLTGLTAPPDPLLWMIRLIGGPEKWKGSDWRTELPACLSGRHAFGKATVATSWLSYTRTEFRWHRHTIRFSTRYVDRAVLILPSFPRTLQKAFLTEHPFAVPLFALSKTPTQDAATFSIDGSSSYTYNKRLFDNLRDIEEELIVEIEAFVHSLHKKKRWQTALREAFQEYCIISREGNQIRIASDTERRIHAAMVAIMEVWFRWLIDTGLCEEADADDLFKTVRAEILPELDPKPSDVGAGSMKIESVETFLRYLSETLMLNQITDRWEDDSKAIVRNVNGESLLILPRESIINTYCDWARIRQIDCSFAEGRKPKELPAKLQRAWMTEAPDLFKDGGRDITWKFGLVDSKRKVAALGLRLESLQRQLEVYHIPVDSTLGQLVCPPKVDTQPELTEVDICQELQVLDL